MKTHLLAVPPKKSDDVAWAKPLASYLRLVYGSSSDHQQDITRFDELRKAIRAAHSDATGLSMLFKYYAQIELLDLRVSFDAVNRSKKVVFTWYDAFQPEISHQQHALPFEKANVLFNIGAVLSQCGRTRYLDSQGGDESAFKEALLYLQQAAGVFQFVGENFLHAPLGDLQPASVKFLAALHLAQAQEIFTLRVISGDTELKKNSVIARLCKAVATRFEECYSETLHLQADAPASQSTYAVVDLLDDADLDEKGALFDYDPELLDSKVKAALEPSWVAVFRFKLVFYSALSLYFHGLHLEILAKYGDALAYITKCHDALGEVPSAVLKQVSGAGAGAYELVENYKYQKDAVGIKIADLTKDNDYIYHEIVPSLVTLPEIKPMDSAKAVPMGQIPLFKDTNDHAYANFLHNVVPINIHELTSYYSEEKAQLLRNELDEVDLSNEELASVLEYLRLPKALVSLKETMNSGQYGENGVSGGPEIDPSVVAIADKVAASYAADNANKEKLGAARKQIYDLIGEIEALTGQYGAKDDLINLKKYLYDATTSDSKLFGHIGGETSHLYSVLAKGLRSSEFKLLFQVQSTGGMGSVEQEISLLDIDDSKTDDSSVEAQIKALEDLLHDLNLIKSSKAQLVDALKKEIHEDDISDILILNSKVKSSNEIKTVIFPEELKKFEGYSTELDKLIEKQKTFVSDLKTQWASLSGSPKVQKAQSSSKFQADLVADQTSRIRSFYDDCWVPYHSGLENGVGFYDRLVAHARSLRDKAANSQAAEGGRNANFYPQAIQSQNSGPPPTPGSHHSSFSGASAPQGQYSGQQPFSGLRQGSFAGVRGQNLAYSSPQSSFPGQIPAQNTQNTHQSHYSSAGPAPASFSGGNAYLGPGIPGPYAQNHVTSQYGQQYGSSVAASTPHSGSGGPAPALPPKRPSQTAPDGFFAAQGPYGGPQYGAEGGRNALNSQQKAPESAQFNGNNGNNASNAPALIYDQPSTYQPNMYNFFLGP